MPSVRREDAAIDWTLSAVEVWRRVRAYMPWPVATTWIGEESLRILEAWPIEFPADDRPGTVVELPANVDAPDGAGFAVVCGSGALAIVRTQRAGKREMSGVELLRGYQKLIGQRLRA